MAYKRITISKLEAARRQLDCALELWLRDGDDVSIHTLAAAAYQIVHDINTANGSPRDLIYDTFWIKDEYRREFVNAVKKPANFFKHADNDPDPNGSIQFAPEMSMAFLMCVFEELRQHGEKLTRVQTAFLFWLALHNPRVLKPTNVVLKIVNDLSSAKQSDMRSLSKADLLLAILETDTKARRNHNPRIPV